MSDDFYDESLKDLHPRLREILEVARANAVRSWQEKHLATLGACFDASTDLREITEAQARNIWDHFGFEPGSYIELRPDVNSPPFWKVYCDRYERKVSQEELVPLLWPGA